MSNSIENSYMLAKNIVKLSSMKSHVAKQIYINQVYISQVNCNIFRNSAGLHEFLVFLVGFVVFCLKDLQHYEVMPQL